MVFALDELETEEELELDALVLTLLETEDMLLDEDDTEDEVLLEEDKERLGTLDKELDELAGVNTALSANPPLIMTSRVTMTVAKMIQVLFMSAL